MTLTTAGLTTTGFTIADLEALPDPPDARRYELIGGAIVMTPSPELVHQRVSRRFQHQIEAAWPEMEVWDAPVDLDLPGGQRVEPDLVVTEQGRTGKRLELPVALVVEIISPGSTTHDRVTKRAAYAAAGIPHYWIVDLPRMVVTVLALPDGRGEYELVTEGPVVTVDTPIRLIVDLPALVRP